MSDLISRQAAWDALDAICDRECEYSKKQRAVMCGACHLGSAFDAIDELPSAERRGSWVGIDDEPCEVWECDQCGNIVERECPPKYCEECGARMDGEEK